MILPLLFYLKIGVKYGRLCLKMASHWLLLKSLAYAYKLGWGRPPSYMGGRGNTWTEFLHIILHPKIPRDPKMLFLDARS